LINDVLKQITSISYQFIYYILLPNSNLKCKYKVSLPKKLCVISDKNMPFNKLIRVEADDSLCISGSSDAPRKNAQSERESL